MGDSGTCSLICTQMILDKESSILGYPGEVSLPLAADHHNVCKFSDLQDSNYKRVKSVLQTLISKILEESMIISLILYERILMNGSSTQRPPRPTL